MPDKFVVLDAGLPSWSGSETLTEKVDALYSHQFQLVESLRYMLRHLDISNFNEDGLKSITDPIAISLREDFNQTEISIDPSGIEAVIAGLESTLSMYVKSDVFETTMKGLNDKMTSYQQTVEGFNLTVQGYAKDVQGYEGAIDGYEKQVSQYSQTVNGFNLTVKGYQGDVQEYAQAVSQYEQTLGSISLSVSSSKGQKTKFTLTAGETTLSTPELYIWTDAAYISGQLSASQIAAGAITADKIAAGAITTDKIAANSITADKLKVDSLEAGTIRGDTIYMKTTAGTQGGTITVDATSGGSGVGIHGTYGARLDSQYGNVFLQSYKYEADYTGEARPQILIGKTLLDDGVTKVNVISMSGGGLVLGSDMYGNEEPDYPVVGQVYFYGPV